MFLFQLLCLLENKFLGHNVCYHDKINSATDTWKLFSTFKSLHYPSPPSPANSLPADVFASHFTYKVTGHPCGVYVLRLIFVCLYCPSPLSEGNVSKLYSQVYSLQAPSRHLTNNHLIPAMTQLMFSGFGYIQHNISKLVVFTQDTDSQNIST